MTPDVLAFFDLATCSVSYIVIDPDTRDAAVIDPVLDFEVRRGRIAERSLDAITRVLDDRGLTLRWILDTHIHADHLTASWRLRERTGAPLVIGAGVTKVQATFAPLFDARDLKTDGSAFDRLLDDGESLPLGGLSIRAMATPGHTPACMTYLIGDAAFVGDALFMPDVGSARCDFPGGDPVTLYRSIRRILCLPPETRLFTGHDYLTDTRKTHVWECTVADQCAGNIHVHDGVSEAAFVTMRSTRDATLDAPVLILPALQVNIRAGALPPPDADGQVRLRLPIGAL